MVPLPVTAPPEMAPMTNSFNERFHDPLAFGRPNHPAVKNSHAFVPKNAFVVALATTIEVPTSIADVNDFRRLTVFLDLLRGGIPPRVIPWVIIHSGANIARFHVLNELENLF